MKHHKSIGKTITIPNKTCCQKVLNFDSASSVNKHVECSFLVPLRCWLRPFFEIPVLSLRTLLKRNLRKRRKVAKTVKFALQESSPCN